jgi:hypothetical protein
MRGIIIRCYHALHHRKLLVQYWLVRDSRMIVCTLKGDGLRGVVAPPQGRMWVLHDGEMPSERIRSISDELSLGYRAH